VKIAVFFISALNAASVRRVRAAASRTKWIQLARSGAKKQESTSF
jgi:hypothetical protein